MKEDHGFTIEEEKNEEIVEINTEVVEEVIPPSSVVQEETPKEEVKEDVKLLDAVNSGNESKIDDKPKKKINIGLIFIGVLVLIFVFIYVFLGQPIINFHATEDGEEFYITFSKLEEKKQEELKDELESKEAVRFEFVSGIYTGTKGAVFERNGNSLNIFLTEEEKIYTATINESERDYYFEGDEEIPYITEYVEFTNDKGLVVKISTSVDGVSYSIGGSHNVFLSLNEEPLSFEGIYRSGEKYLVLFNTYDFMNRLNQVNAYYFDGVKINKLNIFELTDDNNDDVFGDNVIKDGAVVLSGKVEDGNNSTYKLSIIENGLNYNISLVFDVVGTTNEITSINGSYAK